MSISRWGPKIWTFLHTFAEKIKDDANFQLMKGDILSFLTQICKNLPCPTCSAHSSLILQKLNFDKVNSKEDFKNILFLFHNVVNKKKGKEAFSIDNLKITYENNKFIDTYNRFVEVFQVKGNMNLQIDSFQKKILISKLKNWIQSNRHCFII